MKTTITSLLLLFFSFNNAQFLEKLAKKAQKSTERAIERKIEEKATKTTNDGMDVILNNKNSKQKNGSKSNNSSGDKSANKNSDFVAGTKIIFEEKFNQDAEGDFPVNWFTSSSGEIRNFDGKKWLQLSDKGSFSPNNIKNLPQNFTFEFDVTTTDNFNFYSTPLNIVFTEKTTKADNVWNTVIKRKEGLVFNVHPTNSLSKKGRSEVLIISEKKEIMKNKVDISDFNKDNNTVRVQIWRQQNRFRMYIDGKKAWDLPSAFGDANYNQVIFFIGNYKNTTDKYFISNIRLAEAGEDTRHQLLETGTFTTNEILFDVNKATIKPASYKVLDELGNVLSENPAVKISITGHTDSDGNENDNQKLSENRAKAVAQYFQTKYKISNTRLQTFGKGESESLNDNASAEDKEKNRRVEFVIVN